MGTYNPYFQNNVETQRCPYCGCDRPLDWFGKSEVSEDDLLIG